jgi:hypothetical protein
VCVNGADSISPLFHAMEEATIRTLLPLLNLLRNSGRREWYSAVVSASGSLKAPRLPDYVG